MRDEDRDAPPAVGRLVRVERICEDASGCDKPATRGPFCYAHAERRRRGSKRSGPVVRPHRTAWNRLSEAAIAHGDALPADRLRTKERLRKAARVYAKWVRAGGRQPPTTADELRDAARAYLETSNIHALRRARYRLVAAVQESRLTAWERLEAAAIAYSDADEADDKEFRRACGRLRETACALVRWERAGGRE